MINNRIRTIVGTAAGSTLVASVLGLAALGFSSTANAAPAHAPQTNAALAPAPQAGPAQQIYPQYCPPANIHGPFCNSNPHPYGPGAAGGHRRPW